MRLSHTHPCKLDPLSLVTCLAQRRFFLQTTAKTADRKMDEQQRQLIQQMQQQMQQQFQLQMQQMQQQMQQQFQLQVQQMVSLVVPQQEPLPAPPQTQAPPPPVMPARGAAHPARLLGPAPDFPPLDAAPGPTFPAHNAPDHKSPPLGPDPSGASRPGVAAAVVAAVTPGPNFTPRDEPHDPLPSDPPLVAVPGAESVVQAGEWCGGGSESVATLTGPSGELGAGCAPGEFQVPEQPHPRGGLAPGTAGVNASFSSPAPKGGSAGGLLGEGGRAGGTVRIAHTAASPATAPVGGRGAMSAPQALNQAPGEFADQDIAGSPGDSGNESFATVGERDPPMVLRTAGRTADFSGHDQPLFGSLGFSPPSPRLGLH